MMTCFCGSVDLLTADSHNLQKGASSGSLTIINSQHNLQGQSLGVPGEFLDT